MENLTQTNPIAIAVFIVGAIVTFGARWIVDKMFKVPLMKREKVRLWVKGAGILIALVGFLMIMEVI